MANKSNVSIKFSGNAVTTGVALVIIGVLFCILQGAAVQALITTLGVLFILMGAIDLMHKNWVVGAIELAVGIVVIVCTWLILEITLLIIGIVLILYAIYLIATTASKFKSASTFGDRKSAFGKIAIILVPVLFIVFGALLIACYWEILDELLITIGALAIACGSLLIIRSELKI